ncbi:hypothetical protein DDP54_15485 (plasmid) [Cellulomonas sp. WB94]|uniref:hypothetical protein n=1 Tax=Cellulomonas sp. WB94 TaxID=2173174 RepID=UPI000D587747|nr:hypothetical protein [Cellulomonas sp. WB94]PVU81304.1 hypothetical protein DDP54_15485 [Cellulomonas sp. WB94]
MRYYSSIAQLAALTTAVDSSATTMIVSTVAGWPLTCPFTVVVDDSTLSEEIVTVTAVAGTTLTVVRAQDGSAGVSHSVGATVRHMVTARDLREPQEHMDRSAEVHGLDYMSDVVGTNAIQALSNKTIHGDQNTIDEIDQASVINLLTDLGNLYGYTKLAGNTLRATSYNAGDVIVRPDGTLWKAKVYFICDGTFNVANWDPVAVPIFPVTTQAARDALPAGTATKPTYADCLYDNTLQRNVGSGWVVIARTGGAWTPYTPALGSITLGNGAVVGAYQLVGKTLDFSVTLTFGSTTTGTIGSLTIGLPAGLTVARAQTAPVWMFHVANGFDYIGVARFSGGAFYIANNAGFTVSIGGGSPFAWGNGDTLAVSGRIEVA